MIKHIHKKHKNNWFTLVELIVVITIISILATISFISFSWYTERTRDSVRASDLVSITNLLELYKIDYWNLPIPTNGIPITYSWAVVWIQWTVGEDILSKVKNKWGELIDPSTGNEYSYSLLNTFDEYELWTISESEILSNINFNSTYANWNTIGYAYLQWNYNGIWARTSTWGINYIFALPTITTSYMGGSWDLVDIIQNNWLTYRGQNNLPYSYKDSKFDILWWINTISGITLPNLELYSWNNLASLTYLTEDWDNERISLLSNIQHSFTWTNIWKLDKTLTEALLVSVLHPDNKTKKVWINVVNKLLSSTIVTNINMYDL